MEAFRHPSRAWCLLTLPCLVLMIGQVGAAASTLPPEDKPAPSIRVQEGRLSVHVRQARLLDVLQTIGQQAGFALLPRGDLSVPVSESFTNLELTEGLQRLARGYSVVYMYAPSERLSRAGRPRQLSRVWVIGHTPEQPAEANATTPTEAASPPAPDPAEIERQRRATITAATERITLIQDMVPDQGVDAVPALETFLAKEADPRVRLATVEALASINSASARNALEAAAYDSDPAVKRVVERALIKWSYLPR